jgi:hypothetical protein
MSLPKSRFEIAAVTWMKALKTERCFGSLSEENSLMWPMIVSAILRPFSRLYAPL